MLQTVLELQLVIYIALIFDKKIKDKLEKIKKENNYTYFKMFQITYRILSISYIILTFIGIICNIFKNV